MKKLFKILHKKMDKKIKNKEMHTFSKQMKQVFEEEHLHFEDKHVFSYYENEVLYHSILNKRAIENAYMEGYAKMYDYFDVLDFNEKQRLMNYEIEACLHNLPYLKSGDNTIYISFFDEKMNRIYQNEMVLFALKQYRRIMYDYQDLWNVNYYGDVVYDSPFSSLTLVDREKQKSCFYCSKTKRFFFLENAIFSDFICFEMEDKTIQSMFAQAVFHEDVKEIINLLKDSEAISEKLANKLLKKSLH